QERKQQPRMTSGMAEYKEKEKGEGSHSRPLLPLPRNLPIHYPRSFSTTRNAPVFSSLTSGNPIPQNNLSFSRDREKLYVLLALLGYTLSCVILSIVIIGVICNALNAMIIASGVGLGLAAGLGLLNLSAGFFSSNRQQRRPA